MSTPAIHAFLEDLDVPAGGDGSQFGSRLNFQFLPVDGIKRGVVATWKGQDMPGHSHRRLQWGGGGARDRKLKLEFYADGAHGKNPARWVLDALDWLESLTLGEYDDEQNLVRAPHTVLFVVGSWLAVRCKVTSFQRIDGPVLGPAPDHFPRMGSAEVTLEEFQEVAVDYRQLR